jgi:hypothetical protein
MAKSFSRFDTAGCQYRPDLRVVKRLHSHVIARAEKPLVFPVPDRESEISEQVIHTRRAPRLIGAENEFRIIRIRGTRRRALARGRQLRDEIRPAIHARIRCDPNIVAQLERLAFARGIIGGSEQRVRQTNIPIDPQVLRVRPAELLELNQSFQYLPINGSTVHVENAYDTAHQFVLCIALTEAPSVRRNALTGQRAKLPIKSGQPIPDVPCSKGRPRRLRSRNV